MRALVAILAILSAACGGSGSSSLPRLQIPQLEQARESVKGGIGQRYQDHDACRRKATDAKSIVTCMDDLGYDYVTRSAEPHAMECWRLRDWNVRDPLPDEQCFSRR